jgi:hypothetical protein
VSGDGVTDVLWALLKVIDEARRGSGAAIETSAAWQP